MIIKVWFYPRTQNRAVNIVINSTVERVKTGLLYIWERLATFLGSSSEVINYEPELKDALKNGTFLYLGYSSKDEKILGEVTGENVMATMGAIQGLVSYHNINSNKVSENTSI